LVVLSEGGNSIDHTGTCKSKSQSAWIGECLHGATGATRSRSFFGGQCANVHHHLTLHPRMCIEEFSNLMKLWLWWTQHFLILLIAWYIQCGLTCLDYLTRYKNVEALAKISMLFPDRSAEISRYQLLWFWMKIVWKKLNVFQVDLPLAFLIASETPDIKLHSNFLHFHPFSTGHLIFFFFCHPFL
jgi:hypothetical protein